MPSCVLIVCVLFPRKAWKNEEQDQHNEHDVEPRALPERPGGVVVPVGAAVVARLVGIVAEWVKRVRPVVAAAELFPG